MMKKVDPRDGSTEVLILFAVLILIFAGAILWVHYYFPMENNVLGSAGSDTIATTTVVDTNAISPSPETTQAIQAIQYLLQQNDTFLNDTPIALTLHPVSSTQHTQYSFPRFGFSLDVPWSGISSQKTVGTPVSYERVDFNNGRSFSLMQALSMGTSTLEKWGSVSSTLGSEYGLENAAYNATPSEVTSSTPGNLAALLGALIVLKSSLWPPGPVYSFRTGTIEGFQHGDASVSHGTDIDLFYNGKNYNLIITGDQNEIDYIVNSIAPIQ